jgi:hypothetical protein
METKKKVTKLLGNYIITATLRPQKEEISSKQEMGVIRLRALKQRCQCHGDLNGGGSLNHSAASHLQQYPVGA